MERRLRDLQGHLFYLQTKKVKKPKNTKKNIKPNKSKKNSKTNKTYKHKNLTMFSANAAGLAKKGHSLRHEIKECNAAIFSIQETHYKKKGRFQLNDYEIFESIRKNKENGGTMIGIHRSLEPVLIEEYCETFELIVTEIKVMHREIRIISGYGPQETWKDEEKMPFFVALEEEISKAQINGKSLIIELDANAKLGQQYIANDPKPMSSNGLILAGIIERHALIVANGVQAKSEGVITRKRSTVVNTEESVIDFVLISGDMLDLLVSIKIDEERNCVLTSITNSKKGIIKSESDHNSIITSFNIPWENKTDSERIEVFNFRDEKGLEKFKYITDNSTRLSTIFDTEESVEKQTKKFLKKFNRILHQCFPKIRIKHAKETEIDKLFKTKRDLKHKDDHASKEKLKTVETKLADKMAEDLYNIVKEEVSIVNSDEGGFHSGHLWKLKNKLRPKSQNSPTAMLNKDGKLITSSNGLKTANMEHFKKVLENRPIKPELKEYQKEREQLCEERILEASKNVTEDWSEKDVKDVINKLKKRKSRDPNGYSNEIIQSGGRDVLCAITKLMNNIKKQQQYPQSLQACNITSLFKNKGSRKDFNQYRGIFRVTVFRNILDRLIFDDEYVTIDTSLTDSNVGGRKGRNIRDNIFVLNAIVNSIKKGNEDSCDVSVYDVEKCFDALWAQECINTLFECGVQNDKLVLLYQQTKHASIAIKHQEV